MVMDTFCPYILPFIIYVDGYLCVWLIPSHFLILCIYVGINKLFSGFNIFRNTNSFSPSFSITIFEFQCKYINFSQIMPGLCALYGTPSTKYATNVRIWALFPYLLRIIFTSICPSSRSTSILNISALEVNLFQSLVYQLINWHNICL